MGGVVKHGLSRSKIYYLWRSMVSRCYYENRPDYPYYGGRGITVCDRWRNSFVAFYEDMGERPENMTLDRVDNSKGYSPENCRWATLETQQANTRTCKIYKTNKTGISGVQWRALRNSWQVSFGTRSLGSSKDFFEACCLRKSAEQKQDLDAGVSLPPGVSYTKIKDVKVRRA